MVLIAKEARRVTGLSKICLAGGVALNCVANRRIIKEAGFSDIWVQPASGDAGGSLGGALYIHYCYLGNERKTDEINDFQKSSYLGPRFSDEEIETVLKKYNARYRKLPENDLVNLVAKEISDQKVVGWFQGRMEFGPRALGNRSILGDARSEKMQSLMNLKIKFRESFRPFAPSVLEEKTAEYFDFDGKSPYMLLVAAIKQEKLIDADTNGKSGMELLRLKRSVVPAITHVDNSARLQTVSRSSNPFYYKLIERFDGLTDCPVIINTSFNVRGEPIVCSPQDAYICFMGSNIDLLVIGSFILNREEQPENLELKKWQKSLVRD